VNAALFAAAILAGSRPDLRLGLKRYREAQTRAALEAPDPRMTPGSGAQPPRS
jgi:phosphoribosylcarboxyaminoimidazole (NCAIR) mutase